ncbi:hypothetical protein [Methylomonas albis]|nr:hypothetical protein [Methylomonas albis]
MIVIIRVASPATVVTRFAPQSQSNIYAGQPTGVKPLKW